VADKTVLLIEDDADSAEALYTLLKQEGYTVYWAACGDDAMGWVSGELGRDRVPVRPDVILLDLTLPDVDGVTLAKRLRRALGAMPPLLVLSARSEQAVQAAGQELGAHAVLRKPFGVGDLLAAVAEATRAHALEREAAHRAESSRAGPATGAG
jgi:two-component system response regulator MprA